MLHIRTVTELIIGLFKCEVIYSDLTFSSVLCDMLSSVKEFSFC